MVAPARSRLAGALALAALIGAGCNLLFDIGAGAVAPPDAGGVPEAAPPPVDATVPPTEASVLDAADAAPGECVPRGGPAPCLPGQACHSVQAIPVPPGEAGAASYSALAAFGERFYFSTNEAAYSIAPGESQPTFIATTPQPLLQLAVADSNTIFAASRSGTSASLSRFSCQLGKCVAVTQRIVTPAIGQIVARSPSLAWFRLDSEFGSTAVVQELNAAPDGGALRLLGSTITGGGTALVASGANALVAYGKESAQLPTGGVVALDGQQATAVCATAKGVPRRLATTCTRLFMTVGSQTVGESRLVGMPLAGATAIELVPRTFTPPAGDELTGLAVDRSHVWFVTERGNEWSLRAIPLDAFEDGRVTSAAIALTVASGPLVDAGMGRRHELAITDTHVAVLGSSALWLVKKYP